MSYSTNPYLPRARGKAMRMLVVDQLPVRVVANHFGVSRTTIWRWYKKWQTQNKHVQLYNTHKHKDKDKDGPPSKFRLQSVVWNVPTLTSAPHTHPRRLAPETVKRILELRRANKRCAEVIWYELDKEGYKTSVSTVKRTLERHYLINHWSKYKKRHKSTPRPLATAPGSLVEVDTLHYVNQLTKRRVYITTVIDLYTRMSYARASYKLLPGEAYKAVTEAQQYFGFHLQTVQTDNGPEFSRYFTHQLSSQGTRHRHTRVRRPNDNAHIERFNRTLREECLGHHWSSRLTLEGLTRKLKHYLDYYNHDRLHLGLQCKTPIEMLQR